MVANSWLPLTASMLVALKVPTATLLNTVVLLSGFKVTLVLVPTSSYLTPTAALLTKLVLRLVNASPTLRLSAVPVFALLSSMVVVVKSGAFQSPVDGSCAAPPPSALAMFPFWAPALVARSLS